VENEASGIEIASLNKKPSQPQGGCEKRGVKVGFSPEVKTALLRIFVQADGNRVFTPQPFSICSQLKKKVKYFLARFRLTSKSVPSHQFDSDNP
jgi:hypothetical protein